MRRILLVLGLLWSVCGFAADTLFVSTSQVVHLRFASELKYLNLGDRVLIARIVDKSKDYVAVRAREAFEGVTSMSCIESTGEMHSFVVAFKERPERLEVDLRGGPSTSMEELAGLRQELFHVGRRENGMEVLCRNVVVRENVLYLVFGVRNGSTVDYEMGVPRFAVESRHAGRRRVQYQKEYAPKQTFGPSVIGAGDEGVWVFAFDKVALVRGQVLRVYFYEKGGARNFVLTLGQKDLRDARRL